MRWFVLCSFVLLCACNEEKIARLEKETEELKSQLEKQGQMVDLDTQGKCSNAALQFFHRQWRANKNTIFLDYSNHYNKTLGKCFILVEWHYNSDTSTQARWFNVMQINDVFENNRYADFTEGHELSAASGNFADSVITCTVNNVKCSSLEDFQNKTRSYMTD